MYYKPISILFFLLALFFLESNVFKMHNTSAYADVLCDVYAKNKSSYPIESSHKLQQLIRVSDAHSQCLIQLQQQLSENQQDIDVLRGHIQKIQHHISEIIHDQKEIYKKLNQILHENKNIQLFNNNHIKQSSVSNHNSKIYENNNFKNDDKSDNNDDKDYKLAVALVLEKKQYVQAIQTFQDFIKNHPQSYYKPNAYYWLGQLYYNQGKKDEASYHFAWVVKNYPKSSKASDALLKIGIIMQETDQKDKAKTIYKQIIKLYPNSDSAKQAQKRLSYL